MTVSERPTLADVVAAIPAAAERLSKQPLGNRRDTSGWSVAAHLSDPAVEEWLQDLAGSVMTGAFTPGGADHRLVPNGPGRWRSIVRRRRCEADVVDAAFHLTFSADQWWAHQRSYAYRPGRGTATLSHDLRQSLWAYERYIKFDIINFFPEVRRTPVLADVWRVAPDEGLHQLADDLLTALEQPKLQGRGIGPGTVSAGLLGNLVLTFCLDRLFPEDLLDPEGFLRSPLSSQLPRLVRKQLRSVALGYARYSDDGLLLFVGDRAVGQVLIGVIRVELHKLGLRARFNTGQVHKGVNFLGLRYTPQPTTQEFRISPGPDLLDRMADEAVELIGRSSLSLGSAMSKVLADRAGYLLGHGVDDAEVMVDSLRARVRSCQRTAASSRST